MTICGAIEIAQGREDERPEREDPDADADDDER